MVEQRRAVSSGEADTRQAGRDQQGGFMREDVFSWDRRVPPPGVCRSCGKLVRRRNVICQPCREWQSSEEGRKAEKEKDERCRLAPFASICQLSKGRFFWVVINNFSQRSESDSSWADGLLASGYATTEAEARAAVQARYPLVMPMNNKTAAEVHRFMCARKRAANAKPTKVKGSAAVEYLFTWGYETNDYGDSTDKVYWAEHRIVKKTHKRIFILERECEQYFSAEKYSQHPEDYRTYSFDRQKLERDGYVWHRGRYLDRYYTEEGRLREEAERIAREDEWRRMSGVNGGSASRQPNCFTALGLSPGRTKKDIKKAFRRKSRELHPDSGGDHESFIALRAAYENALSLYENG